MTRDVPAARAWYEAVCGWRFDEMPMEEGTYHVAMAHGKAVAGVMSLADLPDVPDVPPHWFPYLAVDDLAAALAAAQEFGGEVMRAPFDIPDVGRIAMVRDAGGAALGLMVPVTEWDPPDTGDGGLENVPV